MRMKVIKKKVLRTEAHSYKCGRLQKKGKKKFQVKNTFEANSLLETK
jgi:hypothetical protein